MPQSRRAFSAFNVENEPSLRGFVRPLVPTLSDADGRHRAMDGIAVN